MSRDIFPSARRFPFHALLFFGVLFFSIGSRVQGQVLPLDPCSLAPAASKFLQQLRDDDSLRTVPCESLSQSEMNRFSQSLLTRTVEKTKLWAEGNFYKAIGLIPPDFEYEQEIAAIYSEASVGVYDSRSKSLKLLDTVSGSELVDTVVHELNHAFQDQYLGLEVFRNQALSSDELMARSALIEGDSLLVEEHLKKSKTYQILVAKAVSNSALGPHPVNPSPRSYPPTLQKLFLFSYVSGPKYIQFQEKELKRVSFKKLFSKVPRSTSQILHPERTSQSQPEIRLNLQQLSRIGLQRVFSDRAGEFLLSVLLQNLMPVEDISPHWVSDRVEIYADLGLTQGVGVWEIKLDQNGSAEKLADALRSFVTQYPGTKLSVSRGCLRFSWNFPAAFAAPSNFPFLPECKV